MRTVTCLKYICSCFFVVFAYGYAFAGEPDPGTSKILAVVPVKNGQVDKSVYRQFDRLVPELKKISGSRIVTLQCRYSGRPDREKDVQKAYELAAHIEKYLRVRHKLDLELWISIDIAQRSVKKPPVLTLAVFKGGVNKLDTALIEPSNKQQQ